MPTSHASNRWFHKLCVARIEPSSLKLNCAGIPACGNVYSLARDFKFHSTIPFDICPGRQILAARAPGDERVNGISLRKFEFDLARIAGDHLHACCSADRDSTRARIEGEFRAG